MLHYLFTGEISKMAYRLVAKIGAIVEFNLSGLLIFPATSIKLNEDKMLAFAFNDLDEGGASYSLLSAKSANGSSSISSKAALLLVRKVPEMAGAP